MPSMHPTMRATFNGSNNIDNEPQSILMTCNYFCNIFIIYTIMDLNLTKHVYKDTPMNHYWMGNDTHSNLKKS